MKPAYSNEILFVDDDEDILFAGALLLRQAGYQVKTISNPELLKKELKENAYHLVMLDMNFKGTHSGNEGLFWLREIKTTHPDIPVIMVTAFGDIELAVQSIKEGASDFVSKPWDNSKLINTVKASIKKPRKKTGTRVQEADGDVYKNFIGNNEQLARIRQTIEKVAPTDASVLILGENGTGKEVVAQLIHHLSTRKNQNFISIDMGAIPDNLVESELFGHKKGAFTDAKEDRIGRFESANNGTLFLDEIGNLSLNTQAKLLHALQEKMITPLGSNKEIKLNIRIISATNASLKQKIQEGEFRQDLMYRLNTLIIEIPPLRDRKDDIPLLCEHFIHTFSHKYEKVIDGIESKALQKLQNYSWPGNIRELQHVIERAIILSESNKLGTDDFIIESENVTLNTQASRTNKTLETLEKETISQCLSKNNYTISKVAEELGLSRAALYRRMEKYGL